MAEGFALIHAFLVFEGIPRKWSNPQFGEMDADLLNWRELARTDDSEEDDGPLGKPFVQPPASMRSVFDLAQATGSPPAAMRVAIWSDGAIQIRRGDNDVAVLSPSEAKQGVDALDRMLGAVQE